VATVTAARTAARDELFAAERETPASAVACFDVYVDFVNKHRNLAIEQSPDYPIRITRVAGY
jgi:hypothetical protein